MAGKIGTSSAHWFARGFMGGLLLMASVNAVSYFVRTGGFGGILGYETPSPEAIGFPLEVWRDGFYYAGQFVNYWLVAANVVLALPVCVILGIIGVWGQTHFNRLVEDFEDREAQSKQPSFQFSTKSLLILTTLTALVLAALSTWRESRMTLAVIYLLGPVALITVSMLPDRIRWVYRAAILVLIAKGLIAILLTSGMALKIPFDRIMLGVFVCWVPQSVFAAFVVTVGLIYRATKQQGSTVEVTGRDLDAHDNATRHDHLADRPHKTS